MPWPSSRKLNGGELSVTPTRRRPRALMSASLSAAAGTVSANASIALTNSRVRLQRSRIDKAYRGSSVSEILSANGIAPRGPLGVSSKSRRLAEKRLTNDFGEVSFRNRPRMRDFDRRDDVDGFADVFLAQAETLQPGRQAEPHIEIVKAARRVAHAERALDARHGFGCRGAVEADGVGCCDGVGVGVVEIEPLPHPLRDGVFEPDLGAEICREPSAVEHFGS